MPIRPTHTFSRLAARLRRVLGLHLGLYAPAIAVIFTNMRRDGLILCVAIPAMLLWSGCSGGGPIAVKTRPATVQGQLLNVYRPPVQGTLTRVAMLPISGNIQPQDAEQEIENIFHSEFNQNQTFEGVAVSRQELTGIIRQEDIASNAVIPPELFPNLRERDGAEAVLFTDITYYRPYRPIAIGVSSKLVSIATHQVLWSVDVTFDSSEPAVAAAAREYNRVTNQDQPQVKAPDAEGTLLSPRRFARFVAREIYNRLPARAITQPVASQ